VAGELHYHKHKSGAYTPPLLGGVFRTPVRSDGVSVEYAVCCNRHSSQHLRPTEYASWGSPPLSGFRRHARFRVYAFDPQSANTLDTAPTPTRHHALPREEEWEENSGCGPRNDYLEVVERRSASGPVLYEPVNLATRNLWPRMGWHAVGRNPQFHAADGVFALAMKVIRLFKRALDARIIWAPNAGPGTDKYEARSKKLRVYPATLCARPMPITVAKSAPAVSDISAAQCICRRQAGFHSCCRHDIIAHETTPCVPDALHPRYAEPPVPTALPSTKAVCGHRGATFSHFTADRSRLRACSGRRGRRLTTEIPAERPCRPVRAGTTCSASLRQLVGKAPKPNLLCRDNRVPLAWQPSWSQRYPMPSLNDLQGGTTTISYDWRRRPRQNKRLTEDLLPAA
jgi:hypothetical protein